jgi:hypothetical protein
MSAAKFNRPISYDPTLLEKENELRASKQENRSSSMASELGIEEDYNLDDISSPTANPITETVDLNNYGMFHVLTSLGSSARTIYFSQPFYLQSLPQNTTSLLSS